MLTHRNYRAIIDMISEVREITEDEIIYLYLPLAHSYALLIQLAAFELGSTLAYFGGDTKQIIPELQEVKPTYLPVGAARVREDLHARPRRDRGPAARGAGARAPGDRARREGARHEDPR